jgi:cytochrome c oxidase assembly protein subunit 11
MSPARGSNRKLASKLFLVAAGMFGFGFAMWPIYNVICDITGLGGRGVKVEVAGASELLSDRVVKLRFDATVNSALPWDLQPNEPQVVVQLGEMSETSYLAINESSQQKSGQAIYTVTPPGASLYFVKTECFCFTRQTLAANESREMPVRFYIKPDLPEHIKEMTLSYTFFEDKTAAEVASNEPTTERQE